MPNRIKNMNNTSVMSTATIKHAVRFVAMASFGIHETDINLHLVLSCFNVVL